MILNQLFTVVRLSGINSYPDPLAWAFIEDRRVKI